MTRLASVLVLAALVAAPGCTLYFDDGDGPDDDDGGDRPGDDGDDGDGGDRPDDPDRPPPGDPNDPGSALLIIGQAPTIERSDGDWATVWLNYPALDCTPVNLYGATVAVKIDEAFRRFVEASGLVAGDAGTIADGWLTLRRRSADRLWRVSGWVDASTGDAPPDCYSW